MYIKIKKLKNNARMPKKYDENDAAYDLYSSDETNLLSEQTKLIHTGICMEIKRGYYAKIESRSSLASKGIFATGGVIDSGYRDEIMVILNNISPDSFKIKVGDRIAQIIFHRVEPFDLIEVGRLDKKNDRGGGLGSSGQ